jgi:hypothetical protein
MASREISVNPPPAGLLSRFRSFLGLKSSSPSRSASLDPALRREVVAYIRDWLPDSVRKSYQEMIAEDPDGWHRGTHFSGGIVVTHILEGNGITADALGVESLDPLWPELLAEALAETTSEA